MLIITPKLDMTQPGTKEILLHAGIFLFVTAVQGVFDFYTSLVLNILRP